MLTQHDARSVFTCISPHHRPYLRLLCLALACGYAGADRLLERRRRAAALHRGHEEGAGRTRRAAPEIKPYETFVYSAADLRSPFLPSSPGSGARPGRGAPGPEAQPRIPRAVLARHVEDGRHAASLGGPIYGLVQTKDGLVHRVYRGQSHRPGRRQDHRNHRLRKSVSLKSFRTVSAGTWSAPPRSP